MTRLHIYIVSMLLLLPSASLATSLTGEFTGNLSFIYGTVNGSFISISIRYSVGCG